MSIVIVDIVISRYITFFNGGFGGWLWIVMLEWESLLYQTWHGQSRSSLVVRSLVLSALYCQHVAIPVSWRMIRLWDSGNVVTSWGTTRS